MGDIIVIGAFLLHLIWILEEKVFSLYLSRVFMWTDLNIKSRIGPLVAFRCSYKVKESELLEML